MQKRPPTSDLWKRLTSLPAYEKMNQREIGKSAGVGQTGANRWKLGTAWPTLETAIRLATKGGVCVEWLLTGRGPKTPEAEDPDTAALLRHWRVLPPEARKALLRAAWMEHTLASTSGEETGVHLRRGTDKTKS